MCGIAGWIGAHAPGRDAAALRRMLAAIAHRGPDGEGIFSARAASGDAVWLGHRRLAIIDLAGAPQPMTDPLAGLTLVFNGEIYNFRALRRELSQLGYDFQRDSDTEVLLRAYQHWGCEVVHHLRGMFAFAIWDARRQRLFLARDRFGEKPLFLHQGPDGLSFASEIKALRCLPGCGQGTDLSAVRDYLAWRYVPAPRTLYAGIRKLMPGSAALWENGKLHEWRYWVPPDREAHHGDVPNKDVVPAFFARLDEAVSAQMVSDVPFGAFLSGGIDSSMIVGLMTRHCPAVKTYSVGFAGTPDSELHFAAQVAAHFGTTHREIVVAPRDVIDMLPALIAFRDAPVSEPSDVAIHRMALVAARDVKMVLTGEGADEILGGYPKHVYERFASGFQQLPAGLRQRLIVPLVRALPYGFRRAKTAINNLAIDHWQQRLSGWFGALGEEQLARLTHLPVDGRVPGGAPFDADPQASALRRILYFDQTSWLPDNLLERGDRMTMAASLESRVPFLDRELVDFVSGLPDRYRVRGWQTKWLLREAGRQILPPIIRQRRKVGFRVPIERWFRGELRDYLREHLCSSTSLTRAYYDTAVLDALVAEHLQGRQNHEKLLWTLLNLEIWQRQHVGL
jgi:asparagine synthase (glutamine-hydrolysing)